MSLTFREIAEQALKNKGIEPTKERVNSVVASVRVSGVDMNNASAVTACADAAVESSMKFDWSRLKKAPVHTQQQETKPELNFTGFNCPRCGKPTVYARIYERTVAYCPYGCAISTPFPVKA